MAKRPCGSLRARLHVEFREDVCEMTSDRLLTDKKLIRDVSIRETRRDKPQNFDSHVSLARLVWRHPLTTRPVWTDANPAAWNAAMTGVASGDRDRYP